MLLIGLAFAIATAALLKGGARSLTLHAAIPMINYLMKSGRLLQNLVSDG
jgi:hypothetical protein